MKIKILFFVLAIVLVENFGILYAQEGPVRMMAPPPGESKIITPSGIATFPFELVSNHIVIPVEINGTVVKLILDTGMPMEGLILSGGQSTEKLNLPIMGKAPIVGGADGNTVMTDLSMEVDFKLPGVEFSDQMVLVMPNNPMKGVDGVIGNSVFKHFVTSINYDAMEITLTEPDKFSYTGKGEKIPLEIGAHLTTTGKVGMKNGEMVPMNLTVDTGFQGVLGLNASQDDSDILPEKCIEAFGAGAGGKFSVKVGRTEGFRIGSFHFSNVLSSFSQKLRNPNKNGGVLGQEILKRFNVIFDYARKSMILEPNAKFDEPFEFGEGNMAGFQPTKTEDGRMEISHIYPDSPAAEAGLKTGDILSSIDGRPVGGLTSNEITAFLGQDGKAVTLGIIRNGESLSKRIVLRRLI